MVRPGIIVSSFFLTVLIFALGILLNYAMDFVRIDTIADVMSRHELDATAYIAEQEFTDSFGGNRCQIMNARIAQLKEEIQKVGADLGSYSGYSFFKKKDYDYLKRKYFLLELRFLTLIEQLNKECNRPYISIIFFYEIDQDESERQGFVLGEISKEYAQEVVVLSLDKDYADEPLVKLLAAKHNVTHAPTIILDSEKREGLVGDEELRSIIRTLLKRADPYGQAHDFRYVLNAAGRNVGDFAYELAGMMRQNLSADAHADILLMLGRILQNDTQVCDSLRWYDAAIAAANGTEEQALLYETAASLDCGRNKKEFLREAAKRWRRLNVSWRAKLDEQLAGGSSIRLKFDTEEIVPVLAPQSASRIVIGETAITLEPGDKVLTQADRVKRDWLGLQAEQSLFGSQILATFSERLAYNASELREDIGWHEGGRMREIVSAGIVPVVAYGTLAARQRDRWYAVDETGIFRFEVPLDKMLYPTTRFLRDDLAVLMDTHGVNMLVEQAVRNNVSAVLSDCDHPGKVKAAKHLSGKGIPVACFPDKYAYLALGHNLQLIGSPPMRRENGSRVVLGGQPLSIAAGETIVVMNGTDRPYALWYYQTPAHYFGALREAVQLKLELVQVSDFNQMRLVTERARKLRAKVIAARVFNSNDYGELRRWLLASPEHRAVLFHSASYPYGYLLLKEFPGQTTFDDPNPRLVP
jgi:hypothetical protein